MKKIGLSVFMAFAVISLCNISSKAITPQEATDSDYLKTHGYSQEMVRLVNVQKSRVEQKDTSAENKKNTIWDTKPMMMVKHWFKSSDCTMSPDFGNNKIKF